MDGELFWGEKMTGKKDEDVTGKTETCGSNSLFHNTIVPPKILCFVKGRSRSNLSSVLAEKQ